MFTNEFDFDETVTTVLDDTGRFEDVSVYMDEEEVYIRQWNEKTQSNEVIVMTTKMYYELIESIKYPEGAFLTKTPYEGD